VVQGGSLAWELPPATGMGKKKKNLMFRIMILTLPENTVLSKTSI